VKGVRNLTFSGIRATNCADYPYVMGCPDAPVTDVDFDGCSFSVVPEATLPEVRLHRPCGWMKLPGGRADTPERRLQHTARVRLEL